MKILKFSVSSSDNVQLSAYKYVDNLSASKSNILFSHANGFHGRCFDPVIATLIADYEGVSFDLRGHCDSVVSSDWPVAWQGYGDDALAMAKQISKPPIAVGHSMGGAALVMAALVETKLFRALILYEPIIFPSAIREIAAKNNAPSPLVEGARRRRKTFASRADAFANYASKPPMNAFDPRALHAFVDYGFRDAPDHIELKCAPEHEARNFEMGAIHETWDSLKDLRVPTWVVSGAQHQGQPSGFAASIAEQISNSHFVEWQDLGHFGPMQQPERLADLIREVDSLTAPNT
ncbi:MAG: alpha/beta fold hydrolase [Acidimicrobiaceae bacterium]